MQNKIIFTLVVVIIIISVGGFYLLVQPNVRLEDKTAGVIATSTSTTTEYVAKEIKQEEEYIKKKTTVAKDLIYIGKKNPGKEISIDVVSLKQGGFVVVYENTFEPTGELLAVSEFLDIGEYLKVPLSLVREVEDGEVFTAMLHKDDGDNFFNISDDAPVRNDAGESVHAYLIIEDLSSDIKEDDETINGISDQ